MKKAQAALIIVLFLIMIISFFVIGLLLYSQNPSITGQAIYEIRDLKVICNSPYIRVGESCCMDYNKNNLCDNGEYEDRYFSGTAFVTSPFYINSWNAEPTGFSIELMNNGEEEYIIKGIRITNCGLIKPNEIIYVKDKESFNISCSLISGDRFNGDITIDYSKKNSGVILISTGTISEKVS